MGVFVCLFAFALIIITSPTDLLRERLLGRRQKGVLHQRTVLGEVHRCQGVGADRKSALGGER